MAMSVLMRIVSWMQALLGLVFAIPLFGKAIEYWAACLSSLVRLGPVLPASGEAPPAPAKPIILYEYEGCPFCAKVREAAFVLGLQVLHRPTPRETLKAYGVSKESRFRPVVKEAGGKLSFPYLVDENTGKSMSVPPAA